MFNWTIDVSVLRVFLLPQPLNSSEFIALPQEIITNPEIGYDEQGRKVYKGPEIRIRDLVAKLQERSGKLKCVSCLFCSLFINI